jgi:lipopolysaccharide transport system permease protein
VSKIIIDANKKKRISLNFKELFEYKDLLFVLAYRDLRIRYVQTFLGFAWAIFQPLITLLIYTLVFGLAIRINTHGVPYPLFAFSGMFAWAYFAYVMSNAGASVINAQNMISKIYFPRLIIPLSKALVALVDLGIHFLFLGAVFLMYQYAPSWKIFLLPIFILLLLLCALGVGIWLSALVIRFRDFQQIANFALQIGAYLSPIAYPSEIIPEKYQLFYFLNPMAGVIEGIRWSLLDKELPPFVWISYALVGFIFISSLFYFRKIERVMADII